MTHPRTRSGLPFAPCAKQGQIEILALVFLAIFIAVASALTSYVVTAAHAERSRVANAEALALAEAGIDHAATELNAAGGYTGETGTPLGAGTFSVTVANIDSSTKRITATGYVPNSTSPTATQVVSAELSINTTVASFHYGVQVGAGGLSLKNSASVVGNVYSDGPIAMSNSSHIDGDAVSAGASGSISGSGNSISGSAYAHTLSSISAGADAYYVFESGVKASGSNCPNTHCHAGSADQSSASLPIDDAQIASWETAAADGGTISACDGSGNYAISANATLGPVKILCNLVISGSATLTVAGPIWVTGNISTSNSAGIKLDSSLGSLSVPIIADNPTNPTGSGIITLANSGIFQGSGDPNSFIFFISQNTSAQSGGSTVAISMANSANSIVLYASHGQVALANSVHLKEATAYLLTLQNSVQVTYDSGLASASFTTGPGGSWTFVPGSYGSKP